ncbi:24299_t:CDS:2 [Gigaspora margarita]|uniref:24299_t:CDS:1 n=1 Tax=Gigaspora margarita TaxID=4874 RepID=A0ABN7UXG6_GIGMA|nr:24299_t:CDS:2 [Gigaspora margarita]
MIEKPKKHSNYSKHHDKLSMIHFPCEGYIKITIYQNLLISDINMRYKLHSIQQDVSISNEIKDFIANNIDLLFHNTNNLRFELYVVHVEIDGSDFFVSLKMRGLEPEFFLSDKDFSQIFAAKHVWKDIKIQLYLWHIKRAVGTRLANNKKPQNINYNGIVAQQYFSFIDPLFQPNLNNNKIQFCPKEL